MTAEKRTDGRKARKELLSFADLEQEDEPLPVKRPRLPPDPDAAPSCLPDFQKSQEEAQRRAMLEEEYRQLQLCIKDELLTLTVMYWDGSTNRHAITVKKATTISEFLASAREILVKDFPVLKKVPSDLLMFVKGDMILPHFVTFYDLLVAKAEGRSGPILSLRKSPDGDQDEAGVGKILERKWYEKHRHIFPASQWSLYDPAKSLQQ